MAKGCVTTAPLLAGGRATKIGNSARLGGQAEIRQLRYLGVGAVPELSFPPIGIQDPPSLLGCKITLTEQISPVQMYDVVEFGLLWCSGGRT